MSVNIVSGHTPGPWQAARAGSSVVGIPIVGPGGRAIGSLHWAHLPGLADFNKEQLANALLIAAAPDLLEALRELERVYETGDFDSEFKPALEKARAAIAKAEGKQ